MSFEDEIWCFNGTEEDGAYSDTPFYMDNIKKDILDKLKLISIYYENHDYYRVKLEYIKDLVANAVIVHQDTLEFHYYSDEEELEEYYKDTDRFDDLLIKMQKSDLNTLLTYLKTKGAAPHGKENKNKA